MADGIPRSRVASASALLLSIFDNLPHLDQLFDRRRGVAPEFGRAEGTASGLSAN